MNDQETDIVFMLNELYEKYSSLPVQHHKDMDEFINAIHVIQHLVMIRSVRRQYPEMFPINLITEASMSDFNDTSSISNAISETINNAMKENQ